MQSSHCRRLLTVRAHLDSCRHARKEAAAASAEEEGSAALTCWLSRPRALNAVDSATVRSVQRALDEAERRGVPLMIRGRGAHFCAGGDIKAVALMCEEERFTDACNFFRGEFQMLWRMHSRFAQPTVALIEGFCFGGGLGLAMQCSYRVVVADSVQFAMPEAELGYFCDIGASHFLRPLGAVGLYLALTGARVTDAADALWLGLATHVVPSRASLDEIQQQLSRGGLPLEAVLAQHCVVTTSDQKDQSLRAIEHTIMRCFGSDVRDIDDIVARLQSVEGDRERQWAEGALQRLAVGCRSSLDVILMAWQRAEGMGLDAVLEQDVALAGNIIRHPNFVRGVRHVLMNKRRGQPVRWQEVDVQHIRRRWFLAPITNWRSLDLIERSNSINHDSHNSDGSYGTRERQIWNAWNDTRDFSCYGCARSNTKGLHLVFFLRPQQNTVVCYPKLSDDYCSFNGVMHGGVVSTLVDEVAYFSFFHSLQRIGFTANMNVRYLAPLPLNRLLRFEGRVTGEDRAKGTIQIRVEGYASLKSDARPSVSATVVYLLPKSKKMVKKILGSIDASIERFL